MRVRMMYSPGVTPLCFLKSRMKWSREQDAFSDQKPKKVELGMKSGIGLHRKLLRTSWRSSDTKIEKWNGLVEVLGYVS